MTSREDEKVEGRRNRLAPAWPSHIKRQAFHQLSEGTGRHAQMRTVSSHLQCILSESPVLMATVHSIGQPVNGTAVLPSKNFFSVGLAQESIAILPRGILTTPGTPYVSQKMGDV